MDGDNDGEKEPGKYLSSKYASTNPRFSEDNVES